jgi:hypothetical protein
MEYHQLRVWSLCIMKKLLINLYKLSSTILKSEYIKISLILIAIAACWIIIIIWVIASQVYLLAQQIQSYLNSRPHSPTL